MLAATAALLIAAAMLWFARPHPRDALRPIDASRIIDLNAAGAAELGLLPGIGPTLGRRIVEHRAVHGPFGSVEDLRAVPGIGAVKLEDLRPYARVGAAAGGESDHVPGGGSRIGQGEDDD